MDVILLEKVHNLGGLGDRVSVRAGYGRNFLIPSGKAVSATPANVARFEAQRAELERAQTEALAHAQARAEALDGLILTIAARTSSEGRLFGSIGNVDIADAISQSGAPVAKREVRLPAGPLRDLGDHTVQLHLHTDVNATVTVRIIAEGAPVKAPVRDEDTAGEDDSDDHAARESL